MMNSTVALTGRRPVTRSPLAMKWCPPRDVATTSEEPDPSTEELLLESNTTQEARARGDKDAIPDTVTATPTSVAYPGMVHWNMRSRGYTP